MLYMFPGVSTYDDKQMVPSSLRDNSCIDLQVDNVRLMTKYGKKKAAVGTLYLTATHLIFVDPDCSKETWVSY